MKTRKAILVSGGKTVSLKRSVKSFKGRGEICVHH